MMGGLESLLGVFIDPEGRKRLTTEIQVWFLLGIVWLIVDRVLAALADYTGAVNKTPK